MPPTKARPDAAPQPSVRRSRIVLVCAAVGIVVAVFAGIGHVQNSPEFKLLAPEHGAQWIRSRRTFTLEGRGVRQETRVFQKVFVVKAPVRSPVLTIRAFRTCAVSFDGMLLYPSSAGPQNWKVPSQIALPDVPPGEHSLAIMAENKIGPAAILAYCEPLGLATDRTWMEHAHDQEDVPVATADDVDLPELSGQFPSPAAALQTTLWWFVPAFVALWFVIERKNRQAGRTDTPVWWSTSRLRFVVLAAWLALAANNFAKLPNEIGYDLGPHVDYIRFVAEQGTLPDARQGPQMFQAPLFYVLAAGCYRLLTGIITIESPLLWLRWLPLLCGIAQTELCFRAARIVFPGRDDQQTIAVLVGGLLPMNVYMSQFLGNEPLGALLTATTLVLCWKAQRLPETALCGRWQIAAGATFGLALLAKMSALLLAAPLAAVVVAANRTRGLRATVVGCVRCFGTAGLVAGWFYFRNWLIFGMFFVGGWDPVTGLIWWQDPGYRTPRQLVSFGQSLWQPIHAGFFSIWDGFFATLWLDGNLSSMSSWETRPPWRENLLLSAPWPALLLTAAIVAGCLRSVWSRETALRRSLQLASGTLLLYLAAFVLLCLEMPAFSQAKASYTLGLAPVYALLCAAGYDLLPPVRRLRSAALAFVICWSVLIYGTHFVT